MYKRLLGSVVVIICLCGSASLGLTPMGQPTAGIEAGRWSLGADYSLSEVDLKLSNVKGTSFFTAGTADDVDMNFILGKLSYGLNQNWEVFVGLGTSKTDYEATASRQIGLDTRTDKVTLDGDFGFAAQIGAKTTFYKDGPLSLGVLAQLTWSAMDGTYKDIEWINGVLDEWGEGDLDADIYLIQVAPGASYQLMKNISVYGGPLFQWITGDGDAKITKGTSGFLGDTGSGDIKQDSVFGGWVGLNADIYKNLAGNIEFQATGGSTTIGVGLNLKY